MKEKKNIMTRRRKGTFGFTLHWNSMVTTGSLLIQEATPGSFIRKKVAVKLLEGTAVIVMKMQDMMTLKVTRPTLLVQRASHSMGHQMPSIKLTREISRVRTTNRTSPLSTITNATL
jgi:hypothetical protein